MTDTRICDYEGANYRQEFWEGGTRRYEDLVERQVLQALLPRTGQRLLEVGAGFGRLSREYRHYQQVVLLDYSFSQLQYARQQLGDEGYVYVAADAYKLPFQAGVFDGATMIRVLHHFENVPAVLAGIRRTLAPRAQFILEFANKRNLKAQLRYALGKQSWNPNTLDPVEFVELNYNFHPTMIAQALQAAGFSTQTRIPVSFLRVGALKRFFAAETLASLDRLFQRTGWLSSPSIFTLNEAQGTSPAQVALQGEAIFACPQTGGVLRREGEALVSAKGVRYPIRDGIYVFKSLDD